jgi:hypothetical protein
LRNEVYDQHQPKEKQRGEIDRGAWILDRTPFSAGSQLAVEQRSKYRSFDRSIPDIALIHS